MSLVPLAILFGLVFTSADAFSNQTVLWQFTRDNGVKLFGSDLRAELTELEINADNTLTFEWNEGIAHSLFEVPSQEAFDACDVNGGIRHINSPTPRATVVLDSLTEGRHFFIDDSQNACSFGLKISVFVNPEGFTTEAPQTTPPQSVTETESEDDAIIVTWHFGTVQPDLFINADQFVRFVWDDRGIEHALREVDEDTFNACDIDPLLAIRELSEPVQPGEVLVSDLSVGTHYFIDPSPTHCSAGSQRIAIHVAPGNIRYFVTLWTLAGTSDQPVHISMTGYDDENRVWTSPERQINQKASEQDSSVSETVSVDSTGPGLFEVFARDVGTVVSLRVRRTDGGDWTASNVRIQKADTAEPSNTFACSALAEAADGTPFNEQFCIDVIPSQPVAEDTGDNSTTNVEDEECGCFREFIVDKFNQRVIACSSDGCFATLDSADSGWSDVPVKHLLGVTTSGRIYGFMNNSAEILVSDDGGITFSLLQTPAESFDFEVVDYTFSVDALTTEPLDEHVFQSSDNSVFWGLSSQGVHVNLDGDWDLYALWACSCEGQCGLRCNQ